MAVNYFLLFFRHLKSSFFNLFSEFIEDRKKKFYTFKFRCEVFFCFFRCYLKSCFLHLFNKFNPNGKKGNFFFIFLTFAVKDFSAFSLYFFLILEFRYFHRNRKTHRYYPYSKRCFSKCKKKNL